jgi:type II restriction enzyme
MQFPHPESGTDSKFKLFPFRLIFKLLNDERLNFKIYAFEFACIISFIETITKEAYESLVLELLNLRKLSNNEIKEIVTMQIGFRYDEKERATQKPGQ